MRTSALATIVLVLSSLASGCARPNGRADPPAELVVFAAASLTEPFRAIAADFSKTHDGVKVTFNFGGSQQLAQQLAQGAPADVLATANAKQMDAVVAAGRVARGAPTTFARNRLVVVTPRENPGRVERLEDLAKPGLTVLLAAKEVPVGQYSLEMLGKAETAGATGLTAAVQRNVVSYEQDVKTVLAKVALGEADAGVVYASDVPPDAREKVARIEIPDDVNVTASYPIAVVADARQPALAQAFVAYVRSAEGQATLARSGLLPTTDAPR